MAQQSEQARLISSLLGKGYSVRQLADLTGRTPRYITQARDSISQVGKSGKMTNGKGQNLIPVLKSLDEKGKASPKDLPERRQDKSGHEAKVRKGVKTIKTKGGATHTVTTVKKGAATLKNSIHAAISGNGRVRWDIEADKIKTKSDPKGHKGWISGHLPTGWTAQTLVDRIANPQPEDNWKAGDVNGALLAIAVEQNSGAVTSVTRTTTFNLFTTDN